MKAVERHLYSRNNYLYYRYTLPQSLHVVFPHKEIKISLSTKDAALARLYVARLDIEVQSLISQTYAAQDIGTVRTIITQGIEGMKGKVGLPQRQSFNLDLLSSQTGGTQKLFSKVVREYLEDCVTNTPKTIEHKRQTYEIFQSYCGDLSFNAITKIEARKFKVMMLIMPANLTKILGVKSYMGVDWNNLPDREKQSLVTVNNRIINMSALFKWAELNDLYEGRNPFTGMMVQKANANATKRHPYSKQHLKTLFSCPVFTGCKGSKPRERLETGRIVIKDYKYWIPLIGLYTGMRLNEICQLMAGDVQCEDGVWIINIEDGLKKLKTASSRRKIPIHRRLIDLGLLGYAEEQGTGRLFKELPVSAQGSYSFKFSKEFTIILKSVKLKQEGLCFHSFRHTFIDGLRNAGVDKSIAMKLVGHHSSNDIHSGYGYGYSLEILQENVNKLSFPILED